MDTPSIESGQVVPMAQAVPVERIEPVEVTTVSMPAVRNMTRRQMKQMKAGTAFQTAVPAFFVCPPVMACNKCRRHAAGSQSP